MTLLLDANNNFAAGYLALASLGPLSGSPAPNAQIAIGPNTGQYITHGCGSINPNANVLLGPSAGRYQGAAAQNGGTVAIGVCAAGGNTPYGTGCANYSMTAIGEYALSEAGATQKDTAVGSGALQVYLRGGQNTAIGRGTAQNLIEGAYNFFGGHAPAFYSVYAYECIAIGDAALNAWNASAPLVQFTGSVATNLLTVASIQSGGNNIAPGMTIVSTTATGFGSYVQIVSQASGTTGGVGTYNLSGSLGTVASQTMAAGPGGTYNIGIGPLSGPLGYNDSYVIAIGPNTTTGQGSHRTAIGNQQVAAYVSGRLFSTVQATEVTDASGATYTTDQFLSDLIIRDGDTAAVSDTTPTAAQIVAAIPGCETGSAGGSGKQIEIVNNNTGTLTLVGGTGVSLAGNTTIVPGNTRRYLLKVTNATPGSEAVTLYGLATGAA